MATSSSSNPHLKAPAFVFGYRKANAAARLLKIKRHHVWPVALALAIFLASGTSNLAAPNVGFSYDKVAHFLVFGLVATSVIRIPFFIKHKWQGTIKVICLISLYGVLDEFRQSFTVGRSVEIDDWIADTLGALLASVLYLKWHWYRRLLELHCFGKKHAATVKQ